MIMKKIFLLSVASIGLLLTSCYKEPTKGTAKVIVIDEYDFRVPAADVTLHKHDSPPGYINAHGITNQQGEFVYEHDKPLEVILEVNVTAGPKWGTNIVDIKPDQQATVTVKIHP